MNHGIGCYLAYNPSKYIILHCTFFQDFTAQKHGFNQKVASLLIYNMIGKKIEYDYITIPLHGLSNVNDAYKIYEKTMPKYVTLYLCLKEYLNNAHQDIFTHLSNYYIYLYYK